MEKRSRSVDKLIRLGLNLLISTKVVLSNTTLAKPAANHIWIDAHIVG
jgi:hypothetical protein